MSCSRQWYFVPFLGGGGTYVKLPPLNMLASLLARDNNDQLGNLGLLHPSTELVHDLLDVGFNLVVA